jgi:uncharacterized membrane protein
MGEPIPSNGRIEPEMALLVRLLLAALTLAAFVPVASAAEPPSRSVQSHGFLRDARGFTTLDVPGASFTSVTGSDGRDRVVGGFRDARRRIHGFLRDRHGFERIDFPGAAGTVVWKANARGQLVGTYTRERDRAAQFFERGFLLDKRGFRRIAVAGAAETRPFAINDRGVVAGEYVDRGGTAHGFLRERDGDVTTIDAPGATLTAAFDVDNRGRAVGVYVDAAFAFHGFVREPDGTIRTIDYPGAADTQLFGINNHGRLAGAQRRSAGSFEGFVTDGERFTSVEVPEAKGGDAGIYDIDDRGRLVGYYDGLISGYLRDERGRYSTFDAPGVRGQTVPLGLNNGGEIVGAYDSADGFHGFLRHPNGRFSVIDYPGAKGTQAARINDRKQIVGIYSETSPEVQGDVRGFLLERGRFTPIDVPGAASTLPLDIEDSGRVAGHYVDSAGAMHGFLRSRRGEFTDVDIRGAVATALTAINDSGQTAGYYVEPTGTVRGFRRDPDGTVTTLDPPAVTPQGGIALGPLPQGMNNRGDVVGAYRDRQFQIQGFRFRQGRLTLVRIPGASTESLASDIDDRGRIVGIDR